MATLEDLAREDQEVPTLADLAEETRGRVDIDLTDSNRMFAAKTAAVADDPDLAVQTYDTVNAEMNDENSNSSETANAVLSQSERIDREESRTALVDFLADPSITDEEKQQASQQLGEIDKDRYNLNQTVKTNSLAEDNEDFGHEENREVEFVRQSFSEILEADAAWRKEQQAILNREASKYEENSVAAWGEIFEHFVPFMESKDANDILSKLREGDQGAFIQSFTLLCNSKMEIRDMLKEIPVENRGIVAEGLVSVINNSVGSVVQDENDYARIDFLRTALEDGYYGEGSRWLDNTISLLDMVGLGFAARGVIRPIASVVKMRRQFNSYMDLTKDTNQAKYRQAHSAVDADDTDETAQALSGSTRDDVIADDILPEVDNGTDAVRAKVNDPDRLVRTAQQKDIINYAKRLGSSAMRPHEEAKELSRVVSDFEHVQGVTARREMFKIKRNEDDFEIKAVYGPSNSGFSSASEAVESVSRALEKYGIEPGPENFRLLQRKAGGYYEPVSAEDALAQSEIVEGVSASRRRLMESVQQSQREVAGEAGTEEGMFQIGNRAKIQMDELPDFLVEVTNRFDSNPFDPTDVKRNLLDRWNVGTGGIWNKIGSLTRHLFDPASMFDPERITRPMLAGAERSAELEARLLDMSRGYTDRVVNLPVERQNKVTEYLHDANKNGIAFNENQLYGAGFAEDEVKAIKAFREYWDTIWVLKNRQNAIDLKQKGWGQFVDGKNNVNAVARAVTKERLPNNVKVYDPETDSIKRLSTDEIDEIYDAGGAVARTRQEIPVRDQGKAEFVVTDYGKRAGRMEEITENTEVLAYREGYYPVQYEERIFIDKVTKGGESVRATATAGSIQDAKRLRERLQKTEGDDDTTFRIREAKEDRSRADMFEDEFDIAQSRGFSTDRVRGERLRGDTSNIDDSATAGILNPVDTMIGSAREVADKVGMQKLMSTYADRIIKQYGDYLPRDTRSGQKIIPSRIEDVKYRGTGDVSQKDLGAAKSHVEYLRYLQGGYINHIDDAYKNILRNISWNMGEAGNTKLEKMYRKMSQTRGPSAMFRNGAFQLYIVANPIRQWIVQSHQATQLAANFRWAHNPAKAAAQMSIIPTKEMGLDVPKSVLKTAGVSRKEADDIFRQWKDSGLGAGVDKQNLIRESLTDLADRTAGRGFRPLHGMRKIGFDVGENFNRLSSFLAHRDEAIRNGMDMSDSRVLEDVIGKSSAYTYGMNKAGDMPYNQNALGILFQFMQVPHKAMLATLTNRSITPKQRLRLLGFNALMYSLPAGAMYGLFRDKLPNPETMIDVPLIGEVNARDLVVQGVEGAMLNKLLTWSTGEETYLNYRGLAPNDQFGMFEMLHGLITQTPGEVVSSTPAGQLFFDGNSRLSNLVRTTARFGNFIDDFEDGTDVVDVAKSAAGMMSGMSNIFKARMALKNQKLYSSAGQVSDQNVTRAEAFGQIFGFGTNDEAFHWWATQDMYEQSQSLQRDVERWYSDLRRHLMRSDITMDEMQYGLRVMSSAWQAFGNDNMRAKEIVDRLLQRDLRQTDYGLYRRILQLHGYVDNDTLRGYIQNMPLAEYENRDEMLQVIDDMEELEDE